MPDSDEPIRHDNLVIPVGFECSRRALVDALNMAHCYNPVPCANELIADGATRFYTVHHPRHPDGVVIHMTLPDTAAARRLRGATPPR